MPKEKAGKSVVEFRSLEEEEMKALQRLQNGDGWEAISQILDFDLPWAPVTYEALKAKVDEVRKGARSALFGMFSGGKFIGLAFFGSQ